MGSEGEYDGLNWRRRRQVKERLQPRSLAWLTTPVSLGSHEGSKRREAPPLATQEMGCGSNRYKRRLKARGCWFSAKRWLGVLTAVAPAYWVSPASWAEIPLPHACCPSGTRQVLGTHRILPLGNSGWPWGQCLWQEECGTAHQWWPGFGGQGYNGSGACSSVFPPRLGRSRSWVGQAGLHGLHS